MSKTTPLLPFNKSTVLWNRFLQLPVLGILCALGSGVCFSSCSLVVKLLPTLNPMEILACECLLQTFIFISISIYSGHHFFEVPEERWFLIIRGITGVLYANLIFYSFSLIPLADASTIAFSAPVFVSFLACILLKEPCGLFQIVSVVVTVVGVVMIAKPTFIFGYNKEDVRSFDR
ncbi:solute carrier family 35 member G1-like, partial [Limulus polyphemus]|uniref:Solute carrier family 35 member G1-like n=1 Tax=Limulus polyphemus TaxID=6850 RepID=A0ABM1C3M4_LIMPO